MLKHPLALLLLVSATAVAAEAVVDANAFTNNAKPETAPVVTLTPTAMTFKDSQAQVTPDPNFTVQGFAERWPHVDLAEAQRLHKMKDVVFVDGRSHQEWEASHIPGAISLPIGEFDQRYGDAKRKLKKARVIVAYCHGENCRLADHLAQQLVGKGHKNVAVFYFGFPGWSNHGLPLEDKNGKPLPTPTFSTPKP